MGRVSFLGYSFSLLVALMLVGCGAEKIPRSEALERLGHLEQSARVGHPLDLSELSVVFGKRSPLSRSERQDRWRLFDGKTAFVKGVVRGVEETWSGAFQLELDPGNDDSIRVRFQKHYGQTLKTLEVGQRVNCSGFLKGSFDKGLTKARIE